MKMGVNVIFIFAWRGGANTRQSQRTHTTMHRQTDNGHNDKIWQHNCHASFIMRRALRKLNRD